jgi:hypothetical protein
LRVITEQPDIAGEPPTYEEMDRRLRESEGFARLDIPPMGHYKSRSYLRGNLGLFDAHPANRVISADDDLIPIDFIPLKLAEMDRDLLASRAL